MLIEAPLLVIRDYSCCDRLVSVRTIARIGPLKAGPILQDLSDLFVDEDMAIVGLRYHEQLHYKAFMTPFLSSALFPAIKRTELYDDSLETGGFESHPTIRPPSQTGRC